MSIKSSSQLVAEALSEVKTINTDQAFKMSSENQCNLIDIRDVRELERDGKVEGSNHIPRGMLEFWLDPKSSYYKEKKIKDVKKLVLFCALGMRSALAAKSLQDMGFKNIADVEGGFEALKKTGFEIIKKEKK